MFVRKVFAIFLVLLSLSGCAKEDKYEQKALNFRTEMMEQQSCDFTADINASFSNKEYEFTVQVQYAPEETIVTVISPEAIAGISASVSNSGAELCYDGAELMLGQLADGQVSPMSVPWLLAQCWLGEYISAYGADGELSRITYLKGYADEELTVDTWFDDNDVPVYAEVTYGSDRYISVKIRDFQFEE